MSLSITIITICFNNLPELMDTCRSIDEQEYAPFEHWIIDGSTTPDIRNYLLQTPQPGYRKWISEPDHGIADAFNKGIERATGDLINMLNAGDQYSNKTVIAHAVNAFISQPDTQWLHGKYQLKRGGEWVVIGKPFSPRKLYRGMRSLCHQTMFVRKQLHDRYGYYDTTLRIAMDYDFLCRIASEKFAFITETLVIMAPGGVSNQEYLASLKEGKLVYVKHYGNSFKLKLWQLRLKTLHYLLSTRIGKLLYKLKKKSGLENL